nr:MAG TPA: hypothetical protein [Caudoviricetes sp.]
MLLYSCVLYSLVEEERPRLALLFPYSTMLIPTAPL